MSSTSRLTAPALSIGCCASGASAAARFCALCGERAKPVAAAAAAAAAEDGTKGERHCCGRCCCCCGGEREA
jgi:hypothetical protein